MVLNRKIWPQDSQIFGSCVAVFAETSLQESVLKSVDTFSRHCYLAWTGIER